MDEHKEYEEEAGYVKEDKRVIHEPDISEESYQTPVEDTSSDDTAAPQTLADVGVFGILRFSVSLLVQQAWVSLGIQAIPGSGDVKVNIPEAKIAIDALTELVRLLGPDLDEAEKKELDAALANLRINFIQRAN